MSTNNNTITFNNKKTNNNHYTLTNNKNNNNDTSFPGSPRLAWHQRIQGDEEKYNENTSSIASVVFN